MPLYSISVQPWATKIDGLIINKDAATKWCLLPYPGHPKGCPNYNKPGEITCPPVAPFVWDVFDHPLWLITAEFDLGAHVAGMARKFPDWSDRQLRNVLYWQGGNKKVLRQRTMRGMRLTGLKAYTYRPEAMGVNVYATAALAGIKLDKIKDMRICTHIALIGARRTRPPQKRRIIT